MDPISLAALAGAFLTAMATSAGTVAGSRLINTIGEKFQKPDKKQTLQPFFHPNPTNLDEQNVRDQLVTELNEDPSFIPRLANAVDAQASERPDLLAIVENKRPSLVQRIFGLSDEQRRFLNGNYCPIGGERVFPPIKWPHYIRPDGTQQTHFSSYHSWPRSTIAECQNGHKWQVFAVTT